MTSSDKESEGSTPASMVGGSIADFLHRWSRPIQALGAIGVVFIGAMAFVIQSEIAEQERERGESERALALSNFFVTSDAISQLKVTAAGIYDNYAKIKGLEPENPHRDNFAKAVERVITTSKDEKQQPSPSDDKGQLSSRDAAGENTKRASDDLHSGGVKQDTGAETVGVHTIYVRFNRLFSEIRRVSNCGAYENFYFDEGIVKEKKRVDSPALCDRTTLRALIMDELIELFFAYRYVFYCNRFFRNFHFDDIKLLENMVGLYLLHDYSRLPNPDDRKFLVFLEDRDRERAIEHGILSKKSRDYSILRLSVDAGYCNYFRNAL